VRSHGWSGQPLEDAFSVAVGVELDALAPAVDEPDDIALQLATRIAVLGNEDPHCAFSFGAYYVQVAWNGDNSLVAETVSNEYLDGPDRLTPRQHRMMLDRGWLPPDLAEGWPNYRRHYDETVPIRDISYELVAVLDLVLGIDLDGYER
jgi:hypothetical protein